MRAFSEKVVRDVAPEDPAERARRLFLAVRDTVRYDPYVDLDDEANYRASSVLSARHGFCIPKAALLAAAARAAGIPARVSFSDVKNHLASPRLRKLLGTEVVFWHGCADLFLHGCWLRATPAFNIELCDRFDVKPLVFDGEHDALLHPFDAEGRRHMEYLTYRGHYLDVPFDQIRADLRQHYPRAFA